MNGSASRRDFEHPLDADPARAFTLPARYYLDPEVFEREKEAIFYRHWHYAGHLFHRLVRDALEEGGPPGPSRGPRRRARIPGASS